MTPLQVKLDENLGRAHVHLVQEAGYAADRVYDQGLSGTADDLLWQHLCDEDRFFVTLDLDFSDIRRFPPGTHPGILLLRPANRGRRAVAEILARVLQEHSLASLRGCLTVASEMHTRIRRPPTVE
jgi:predicted nuclease of predicted toxin-antitoxin system